MKTTLTKLNAMALILILTACGGGGGGTTTGGGGAVSATGFIDWTWVGGNETGGQPSIYSASGVPATAGVPGATEGASSWTDTAGNLWLFGGSDESAGKDVNTLWKYEVNTSKWLWMNGDPLVTYTPPARNQAGNYGTIGLPNAPDAWGPGARQYAATWLSHDTVTPNKDYLWLFGGYVRIDVAGTTKPSNDLWKYDITNKQWTWVGGSSMHSQPGNYGATNAMPGARYGAVSWKDSLGNFWLFGGYGYAESGSAGALNDLWKFDGANWTWVSGSKLTNQLGSYGGLGTPKANNIPGGRYLGVSWIDANNNLWMFGGTGYDAAGMIGDLNDLWKFDGANWTWVSGGNKSGLFGTFGTAGTPASSNVPGSRRTAVAWTDNLGSFWLFGGAENNPANPTGTDNLNDLWKFNTTTKQWVWLSGSNAPNQAGTYGTQGVTAAPNVPGARDTAVAWRSLDGKTCWLLGGQVFVQANNFSTVPYNDFWSFVPK